MAIINFNNSGKISGRIGPVVFFITKSGKQGIRMYSESKVPLSANQEAQCNKFVLLNKELKPLLKTIKRGYPKHHDPFRMVFGQACRDAIGGVYPNQFLDYSKVEMSGGKIKLPPHVEIRHAPGSHWADFYWDDLASKHSKWCHANDLVHIVCYDSSNPERVRTFSSGTRADESTSVEIPADWKPATTHYWFYLSSNNLQENSGCVYLPHR